MQEVGAILLNTRSAESAKIVFLVLLATLNCDAANSSDPAQEFGKVTRCELIYDPGRQEEGRITTVATINIKDVDNKVAAEMNILRDVALSVFSKGKWGNTFVDAPCFMISITCENGQIYLESSHFRFEPYAAVSSLPPEESRAQPRGLQPGDPDYLLKRAAFDYIEQSVRSISRRTAKERQ